MTYFNHPQLGCNTSFWQVLSVSLVAIVNSSVIFFHENQSRNEWAMLILILRLINTKLIAQLSNMSQITCGFLPAGYLRHIGQLWHQFHIYKLQTWYDNSSLISTLIFMKKLHWNHIYKGYEAKLKTHQKPMLHPTHNLFQPPNCQIWQLEIFFGCLIICKY